MLRFGHLKNSYFQGRIFFGHVCMLSFQDIYLLLTVLISLSLFLLRSFLFHFLFYSRLYSWISCTCLQNCRLPAALMHLYAHFCFQWPTTSIQTMLPLPLVLQVRWDRIQSLKQPPDKPEYWTQVHLLPFCPEGGATNWGFPLNCIMLCQAKGRARTSKMPQIFLTPFGAAFSWFCVCLSYSFPRGF